MNFFNSIKMKMALKNSLWSILMLAMAVLIMCNAFSTGFSSDTDWAIGVRGSSGGIPIPNWVLSVLSIIVSVLMAFGSVMFFKNAVNSSEYKALLETVGAIGDVNVIGDILASLPKSSFNKGGELRYNPQLLFYMKGTDAVVIRTVDIKKIEPTIKRVNNSEEYYVTVITAARTVSIKTSKKNVTALAQDIFNNYSANFSYR